MSRRENIEWCNVWVKDAEKGDIPRVLLIGDSITQSYHFPAEKKLGEKFAVARIAISTCVSDPDFLHQIQPWVERYTFDVIHFNNGLHGWDYSEEEYAKGYETAVNWLLEHAPKAKLILALTTPDRRIEQNGEFDPGFRRVRERNRLVQNIASKQNLPVNDLFELMVDHPEYYSEDLIHFNEQGQALLGDRVAEAILAQAGK